jgi:hypothetical protein
MFFINASWAAKRGAAERTTVLVIGGTGSAECVREIEAAQCQALTAPASTC